MPTKLKSLANFPTLGPEDVIAEGDTFIVHNLLQRDAGSDVFEKLSNEVKWQKMFHSTGEVPRLVAVQGTILSDGSKPIYRHPSDQSPPLLPFSPTVQLVKQAAEKIVGHELNHVLIQLYRDGKDYISEHSDKTLDIVHESKIVNASFGARRTMRLRRKRQPDSAGSERETQRIHMPHNSLFVLGLKSNQYWLHGINADKRMENERLPEELAFEGKRISLTFRDIGTFLSKDETMIWGQGAKNKSFDRAGQVIIGDGNETDRMVIAFGRENQQADNFNWEEAYGEGFDVLHFT